MSKQPQQRTEEEDEPKQRQEQQEQPQRQEDQWSEYRSGALFSTSPEDKLNDTIITLRLTKKHYRTAYTLAHMLGHKSLDDYVSYIVVQNIQMEIKQGDMEIDVD